jgi:TRAP-type C4-dicarboxylate transport system substrate-binding protein
VWQKPKWRYPFSALSGCASRKTEAKPGHTFKIASLAPEGSVWVDSFKQFAEEVTEKTDGEIGFRIYPGGIMGDDKAMYRKMRVGQLHGGGFTMTGIADIVNDFRILAIPFMFSSYEEVDHAVTALLPHFNNEFSNHGLQLIAMTEVGFVYTFSAMPKVTIEDLRNGKTWSPSNDPLTTEFLKSLGISPITLTIPDVLSSLQSGLVDTAFNSLYGSIVLQWFTKAPYVTDQPYGYAYGAFIMSQKAMTRISPEHQRIIEQAADKYFSELIIKTRKSNRDSRDVLVDQGVTFVKTTEEVVKKLEHHRDLTISKLVGSSFSTQSFDILKTALYQFRSAN